MVANLRLNACFGARNAVRLPPERLGSESPVRPGYGLGRQRDVAVANGVPGVRPGQGLVMSTTTTEKQQYTFQAEIKQLLHLLAHSLYQSREIALRELISNASDALDKMRYLALTDESLRDDAGALEIVLEGRPGERELVIRDNGIGMTRDELVTNLGTIAHSGSLEFLKGLAEQNRDAGQQASSLALIGQFGVGFYAAFMIADRVEVLSRRAG